MRIAHSALIGVAGIELHVSRNWSLLAYGFALFADLLRHAALHVLSGSAVDRTFMMPPLLALARLIEFKSNAGPSLEFRSITKLQTAWLRIPFATPIIHSCQAACCSGFGANATRSVMGTHARGLIQSSDSQIVKSCSSAHHHENVVNVGSPEPPDRAAYRPARRPTASTVRTLIPTTQARGKTGTLPFRRRAGVKTRPSCPVVFHPEYPGRVSPD